MFRGPAMSVTTSTEDCNGLAWGYRFGDSGQPVRLEGSPVGFVCTMGLMLLRSDYC